MDTTSTPMITLMPEDMAPRAPYHLLTSIAAPRPIAWVSTVSAAGEHNLAPFSFYNAVAGFPPTIMFSVSYRQTRAPVVKDTLRNVQEVGEFVSHVASEDLAEAMIVTSADVPPGYDEFKLARLEAVSSMYIRPLRILAAPVAMECRVTQIVPVEGSTNVMVLGRVVCFHVRADLLRENGLVDTLRMKPLTRLGGSVEYAGIGELIHLPVADTDEVARRLVE